MKVSITPYVPIPDHFTISADDCGFRFSPYLMLMDNDFSRRSSLNALVDVAGKKSLMTIKPKDHRYYVRLTSTTPEAS